MGEQDIAKLGIKGMVTPCLHAARDCGKMDEIFEEVMSIGVILEEKCRASEDSRKSESYA